MDNESQRGFAREMYQSSQEVLHVEQRDVPPQIPQHKKRNSFVLLFFSIILIGIGCGIAGGYYLTTHTEVLLPMFFQQVAPTPITEKIDKTTASIQRELHGFPVYPGAVYIKKETVQPCIGEVSGYTVCDAVTYTWESADPVEKVQLSYRDIVDKTAGWSLTGGAGSIGDGGVTSFSKGEFSLSVHFSSTLQNQEPKTAIIIAVPRLMERMQQENWKTYKTKIGVSLKVPQDILVEETSQAVSFYLDEATKRGSGITFYKRDITVNEGVDVQGVQLKETMINNYPAKYLANSTDKLEDMWIYSQNKSKVVRATLSTVGDEGQQSMQLYKDMLSTLTFEE